MIPYGRQEITQADIDAVVEVLRSDFLTQGPAVPAFEAAVAQQVGVAHAVAVNSATSALHLACMALGLGEGDWLWTSPITFVASANCARYCGAQVGFVDIDPVTFNLSVDALERKLTLASASGRLPKALVAVHMCGQPCEMARIDELSKRFGFKVIEDASHAIGARYRGRPVGNCQYSDVTVFSFHPVKVVTTGEGGVAVTNDRSLAERMALLRTHGITRDPAQMERDPEGPWYYEQIALGYNYRMTDMQAALGTSQMARLGEYVARRNELAARYGRLLVDLPMIAPRVHADAYSSWHLYVIRLQLASIRKTHRQVFHELRTAGIGVNLHYFPVHRQPYYERRGSRDDDCPEADRYYREAITLPLYPSMTEEQQDRIVAALSTSLTE